MALPARRLWPESVEAEARRRFEAGREKWLDGPWWKAVDRRTKREMEVRAIMKGLDFIPADAGPEITPWDAIMGELKRANWRVMWCDHMIQQHMGGPEDLLEGGAAYKWVVFQRAERRALNDISKIALAAGLTAALVRQIEVEAEIMLAATRYALERSGMTDEYQRMRFMEDLSFKLLELETQTNANRMKALAS